MSRFRTDYEEHLRDFGAADEDDVVEHDWAEPGVPPRVVYREPKLRSWARSSPVVEVLEYRWFRSWQVGVPPLFRVAVVRLESGLVEEINLNDAHIDAWDYVL